MAAQRSKDASKRARMLVRGAYAALLTATIGGAVLILILLQFHEQALDGFLRGGTGAAEEGGAEPFPVGVDPARETIAEVAGVDSYFGRHVAAAERRIPEERREDWFARALRTLARSALFQNLASPSSRILVIYPGERREEVVDSFGDILGWDEAARERFAALVAQTTPPLQEGKFFPGRYLAARETPPEAAAALLITRFNDEVATRYTAEVEARVPFQTALTLASLLEREAYTFADMRAISGVLWNRLFNGMPLQVDATLQYVKGSRPNGPWWPAVYPDDKFIDSPFNTYQHEGLPPAPIANPSLAAMLAELNPKKTECMYYFHDAKGVFHCTATYNEHVGLLKRHYGAGR